jgi:hypothetical protein
VQILTQILQIRGALFRSIFGGNECPYLIFRVRRDNLIRDTLLQVRHGRGKADEQKKTHKKRHTKTPKITNKNSVSLWHCCLVKFESFHYSIRLYEAIFFFNWNLGEGCVDK